jgi:hypothetical protein
MVVGNNKSTTTKNLGKLLAILIVMPCGCGGTMRGTSLNGAHPGLHSKPLYAAIGQVHAPYCPRGCHGQQIRKKHTKH